MMNSNVQEEIKEKINKWTGFMMIKGRVADLDPGVLIRFEQIF